ncbi:SHOCT domain-containing protein [Streptomyces sp. NPDC048424]|uniref:SHOCT domain-containing protein n=1 Tax=Streptomyces sp. NPDC048424 TaxID=3155265 RepID=UPI00344711CB
MFIRPMGVTVRPAQRPAGHPLLRGLLARAAGAAEDTAGAVGPPGAARGGLPAREVRAGESPGADAPAEREPGTEPEPEPAEVADVAVEAADTRTGPPTAAPPQTPLVAELRQLADLAREGLLTPEEFTEAKARLLHG